MKIKELKEYAETKTLVEVFGLSNFFSDQASRTRNKRQSDILGRKSFRLLKYAEKRFGKEWWK